MKKFVLPILTGLAVFTLCFTVSSLFLNNLSPFFRQISMKLILAGLSVLIAIYAFKLRPGNFYIRKNFNKKVTTKYSLYAFIAGICASALILGLKLPPIPLIKQMNFLQMIFAVWICSSICEEVFARGMVQGIAEKYLAGGYVPVIAGALVFSLIHFGIYIAGGNLFTTLITMGFTFLLGIFCGLAKSKSNLKSAIIVHIAFNIGGFIGGVVINIAAKLITGQFLIN